MTLRETVRDCFPPAAQFTAAVASGSGASFYGVV